MPRVSAISGHRKSDIEVEDHDRLLFGLQAPEAALELIAIRDRIGTVVGRRLGPDHPDLHRPATLLPSLIGAGVDDKPVEPCIEPIDIPQPREFSPCMYERFLDGVLGALPVAEDEGCDRVEAVASGHREGLEGLVITTSRRFDNIALHRLLHRGARPDGRAITLRRSAGSQPFKN